MHQILSELNKIDLRRKEAEEMSRKETKEMDREKTNKGRDVTE